MQKPRGCIPDGERACIVNLQTLFNIQHEDKVQNTYGESTSCHTGDQEGAGSEEGGFHGFREKRMGRFWVSTMTSRLL